ncbi:MAG: hypothetical protein ACC667_05035 [Longimicrobiales bacterium]
MRIRPAEFLAWGLIAASMAMPKSTAAQGLMVTGYADLVAIVDKIGSDNKEFYFDNYHFNMIFQGNITSDLFVGAEVEYEHGGEELEFEYGFLGYTGIDGLKIMAGKFIVPFGRFNRDLHPTWINKLPDRPNGFKDILPQTYSDVGIWISGGIAAGTSGNRFVYDAWAINGLLGDEGAGIRGLRDNDRDKLSGGGKDDNKMVGARVGFDFAPAGFDIAVSVQTGNYLDDPDRDLTLTLLGADAAYRINDLELRGEIVRGNQETFTDDLIKTGGYVQAAYRAGPKVEPVIRWSARGMPGESADQSRLSFGLNFFVSASSSVRVAYHINSEADGFEKDNDTLALQWNVVF